MSDKPTPPTAIYFLATGLIDHVCVAAVTEAVIGATLNKCPLHILIHSLGGSVSDGVLLYNLLSGAPVEVTTYNMGHVASAAVLPFLAGHKRVVADGATFMVHQPSNGTHATESTVGLVADSLRIDKDRYTATIHARSAIPANKWAITTHNDLIFDAKTAIKWRFADELGLFKPVGPHIGFVVRQKGQ